MNKYNYGWLSIEVERRMIMYQKKYTLGKMIFDFIMTVITGGFWLIWVLIRYLRTH